MESKGIDRMKNYRVLLDLDEVLADFVRSACLVHGTTVEELTAKRTPGVWDIIGTLGVSTTQFWKKINARGRNFWSDIQPLPWRNEVMQLVESMTPDWHIVSSPSYSVMSHTGKVNWLKKHFGHDFTRFCLTPHKEIFAQPNVILIDDREENIETFVRNGGVGVLFPSLGNRLHALRQNPVPYVQHQLEEIFQCT